MKKLVLALTALAAFTGSAMAADLAPRPYTKAPMPMPVAPSWTGFYIFGGAGGGIWDADSYSVTRPPVAARHASDQRMGGDGWFGTVGAGYDWQFNSSWVAGIFADGQFGSMSGTISDALCNLLEAPKSSRTSWAAGVATGLSGGAECAVLRQWRLYRFAVGRARPVDLVARQFRGPVYTTPSFTP